MQRMQRSLLHRGFELLESRRSLTLESFPEGRLGSVLSVAVVSADNGLGRSATFRISADPSSFRV